MAGDWIKVEHATLEKPEVMLMAELLGVRRDEVIGILCRFWVWLDRNTGNGFVTHVSRSGIDEVMHCAGFAGALESVGWCKFDDPARTITLPHADRHNGNPAKTRALAFDRQRKSRHDSVTQTPLPEKRREENTKRERISDPTPEHQELAKRLGIDCAAEWAKYLDHQVNAKNKHVSLEAGFRNWLKRASEFRPPPRPVRAGDAKAAVTAEIWKRELDDEPTDITGDSKRVA